MHVPTRFWVENMNTIVYIINGLPQARWEFISPFEKLKKMIPIVVDYLDACAMCSCQIKKLFDVSLSITTNKE